MGLNSLPAPKNDYEIVVPEDEEDNVDMKVSLLLFLSPSLFLSILLGDPTNQKIEI